MDRAKMKLTPRQRDVIRLVAEGKRSREIADTLGVQPSSVETHIKAACARCGVRGRMALVRHCRDHGYIQ
jgi:DNA-binding NarL/FixJ family response regulator